MSKVLVFPGKYPWELRLRFPFNEELKNELKRYPGIQWRKAEWGGFDWHCPREGLDHVAGIVARAGLPLDLSAVPGLQQSAPDGGLLNPRLWPFQREHVLKALGALPNEGAFILNNEMGLGKSPEAIEVLRLSQRDAPSRRSLVLAPAMVREDWRRKIDEWWPGHPEVEVVTNGKQAAAVPDSAGIVVSSYGLVPKLRQMAFGAVVFDELHYLQGESAARTMVCERLLRKQATPPLALGLTGTLISNTPLSMWKPLDVLFPGRFGTRNQFGARYCKADPTGFGNLYHGASDVYAEELRGRLGRFTARATKADPAVQALLPPFVVQKAWTPNRQRVETAAQLVADAFANGVRKIVCLTHRRDSAESLARAIAGAVEIPVGCVTGEQSPVVRDRELQRLGSAGAAVLCATMHAVGIGIDLTWAEEVFLVELSYSPTAVLQALGRFSRLSGRRGVRVTVLLSEGKDAVGEALAGKIGAASAVIAPGQSEAAVSSFAQAGTSLSAEEEDALLRGMAAVSEEE